MREFEFASFKTDDDLAQVVAREWLTAVREEHRVALSGGRIAGKLFSAVVAQAGKQTGALASADFFWADERCVPPADPGSNFGSARTLLLDPLHIPPENIHRIRGEAIPQMAAVEAAGELIRVAGTASDGQPVLDLVFLGMGEDGHVASLFPGEAHELMSDPAVYRPVWNSPKPPSRRVTLGYGTLAAAREVWVLVTGEGKAQALKDSLEPGSRTPLGRVLELRRHTRVFSDISL
jgi:6-phosphogluconolactonase